MVTVPLQLWNRPHWELTGRPDSAAFFKRLAAAFPSATSLYIEGTSLAKEVEDFLRSSTEAGAYLPKRQTLWPRPKQFRLSYSVRNLTALASLADRHAEPELLDHFFVYAGAEVLLEYPDAFGANSPVFLSADVPEEDTRSFAAALGLKLRRFDDV